MILGQVSGAQHDAQIKNDGRLAEAVAEGGVSGLAGVPDDTTERGQRDEEIEVRGEQGVQVQRAS